MYIKPEVKETITLDLTEEMAVMKWGWGWGNKWSRSGTSLPKEK